MFEVALVEPTIPPNTGSIARLCAATRIPLHLIEPLGFEITDSRLKRAGLDYWKFAQVSVHRSLNDLIGVRRRQELCFFSKKAVVSYVEVCFEGNELLVFGSETNGLSEDILNYYHDRVFKIPMLHPAVRSLNLSNAVSIIVYEALRQTKKI